MEKHRRIIYFAIRVIIFNIRVGMKKSVYIALVYKSFVNINIVR